MEQGNVLGVNLPRILQRPEGVYWRTCFSCSGYLM
uniref:Uncharacterized protein n=1 Tax=Rhizophora mucronata TaxID=61149 RepID=A0A2P2N5U3_RHIMU